MLKRLLIFFTLIISLLATVEYYYVFKMKQWQIHERIEAIIESLIYEKELSRVEISLNDVKNLKWERAGKEFWLNGTLHDVAYSETNATSIVFYCINDTEETELYAQFDATLQKQLDSKKDASSPLTQFFKKDIQLGLPQKLVYSEQNNPSNLIKIPKISSLYLNFYAANAIEKVSPPPKFAWIICKKNYNSNL